MLLIWFLLIFCGKTSPQKADCIFLPVQTRSAVNSIMTRIILVSLIWDQITQTSSLWHLLLRSYFKRAVLNYTVQEWECLCTLLPWPQAIISQQPNDKTLCCIVGGCVGGYNSAIKSEKILLGPLIAALWSQLIRRVCRFNFLVNGDTLSAVFPS